MVLDSSVVQIRMDRIPSKRPELWNIERQIFGKIELRYYQVLYSWSSRDPHSPLDLKIAVRSRYLIILRYGSADAGYSCPNP